MAGPPPWIEVPHVTVGEDSTLRGLDPGEREAITLAENLRADALIMDDQAGRKEAERRSLRVIGTLRVLSDAAEAGLVDLAEALETIQRAGFYLNPSLTEGLLKRRRRKETGND